MKKVIAAAAGLMLVGTMVGTASAAVSLSGDARVRWYYEKYKDGTAATEKDEKFSSRVRVKVNADAKGGAYMRSRIRMADAVWSGTDNTRRNANSFYVDYAYIGVPLGPVTFEGGLMPANLTPFFYYDRRADMAILKWSNDTSMLQAWWQKELEDTTDLTTDDDINQFFVAGSHQFAGDWKVFAAGAYVDDNTPADISGFTGTAKVTGPAGPVAFEGEISYVNSDLTLLEDDGWGGYIQGGMDFAATSVTLNAGFTKDGFAADDDFGFIMIGGASAITPALQAEVGSLGDTWWIGGIVGFKASEALKLTGTLAYASIDEAGGLPEDATLFEIAGKLDYAISDGAAFQWVIGYLNYDNDNVDDEESPFGTAATFSISF